MKKVICIMGPTGSGKTGIALELAKHYPIAVINADSRQIYADFPIVSAQPNADEMAICPHKLYGLLDIDEKLSAVAWADLVKNEIENCYQNKLIPVLVGGTGFYFKTLLDGISKIPDIPIEIHEKYIERVKNAGSFILYEELKKIDFAYANKIHFNDKQRIARALEVFEATGKTFSQWHVEGLVKPEFMDLRVGIGLELNELTPFLYQRTEVMLKNNAIEEISLALEKNSDLEAAGFSSIGCREIANYINGVYDLKTCMNLWNKNTRAYAKRQWTWFRADKKITWFRPDNFDINFIDNFLHN